jgi:hypothetical protein
MLAPLAPGVAGAQPVAPAGTIDPAGGAPTEAEVAGSVAVPIPPHAEGQAVPYLGSSYCYVGPHPIDTRVAAGPSWHEASDQHTHTYAPVDLRLFAFKDGCYHFVSDPRDFGYAGPTYSYYGAHPVLPDYGGGWCFMMGGHGHFWRPWSHHFTVVGPWFYWQGPYDPYFWSYWPYYSFYYRSYYPRYYAGGRFGRDRSFHVAPRITRVPPAPAHAPGSSWSSSPSSPPYSPGWRTASPTAGAMTPPPSMSGVRVPARGYGEKSRTWRASPQPAAPGSVWVPSPSGSTYQSPLRVAPGPAMMAPTTPGPSYRGGGGAGAPVPARATGRGSGGRGGWNR